MSGGADSRTCSPGRYRSGMDSSRAVHCLLLAVTVLCSGMSAGCYTVQSGTGGLVFDKLVMNYRDRVWAARAWNQQTGGAFAPIGDHYRQGFVDGYCGVCQGGDGYVPALPPDQYWSARYQSAEGASCVNDWFSGYPRGAAAAKKHGAGSYNDLYVSRMMDAAIKQQGTEVKLPSDVRVVRDGSGSNPPDSPAAGGEASGPRGPLPLPNRDWSSVFPRRDQAAGDSAAGTVR